MGWRVSKTPMFESSKPADSLFLIDPAQLEKPAFAILPSQIVIFARGAGF
jgi:hypothetical protein